jgi:hypothetical protein
MDASLRETAQEDTDLAALRRLNPSGQLQASPPIQSQPPEPATLP